MFQPYKIEKWLDESESALLTFLFAQDGAVDEMTGCGVKLNRQRLVPRSGCTLGSSERFSAPISRTLAPFEKTTAAFHG